MLEKLRYLTSGESHGQALTCIIDGIPSNLSMSSKDIDKDLARRQKGYGRGGRMKIETDHAQILSGVRHGKTIGSPITLLIENKDWDNWQEIGVKGCYASASRSCRPCRCDQIRHPRYT
jgi:chorismate synthase